MGFLDPPCTVISLLQKYLAGSNLNRLLCIHAYLREKYLNKLEKHILGSLILSNLQHYNHSSLSYDHIQVIYGLPWEAKFGFPFLRLPYMRKLQNIIALLHLSITYLSITYFIWCKARYTMRQIRSKKLQGAQPSPELGLRSTEFCAPENLIFPALNKMYVLILDIPNTNLRYWDLVYYKWQRHDHRNPTKKHYLKSHNLTSHNLT